MNFSSTTMEINHLGFSAVFLCISLGFLFVRIILKDERGPGAWSGSFFLNSVGFLFWSGKISMFPWQYFLIGEMAHMAGFILLVVGVYRFTGRGFTAKNVLALSVFLAVWLLVLAGFDSNPEAAVICLRFLRTSLFFLAGARVLRQSREDIRPGEKVAGSSLVIWGAYNIAYGFIRTERFNDYVFGFLVGLQVLAAFGLIAMLVDKIHISAEKNEVRVNQLERLLPICAHCRRIRDGENEWHNIESYIEEKTQSQFSHGICPDCLKKHFPEYANKP